MANKTEKQFGMDIKIIDEEIIDINSDGTIEVDPKIIATMNARLTEKTPADEGIEASIDDSRLAAETRFMENKITDFKDFVLDSMTQEIHLDFDDHFEFLKKVMELWIELETND